ncbi:hypothetical protein M3182_24960 [Mesobacillus maritimus]|uniref:hypothetical protein n=1 Tax=Mesobacillus maritimus TaxID=1643336 RepID=UPI00203E2C0B|nr:hypothetical protein [Mesobacillus maritimus]MCM3588879.1 hypothetical protein [Mesobacillus maritimus]
MKNMLKGTKKKVVIGALSIGLVSGGLVGASSFGFIQQLENILSGTTDKAATETAKYVTNKKDGSTYEEKIKNDVDNAALTVKNELVGHATSEMRRGNGDVETHYNNLKSDIEEVAQSAVESGETKITNAVDAKVTSIQSSVEDAAIDAINAQLNTEDQFTGTETVSK